MRLPWGRRETLAFAAQVALVLVACAARNRTVLLLVLALLLCVSAATWITARRRAQAIADTPTSKASSAAQGYVELCGRAEQFGSPPTVSPYTGLPCVWYRYRVEERNADNRWVHRESRRSDQCFRLVDESGGCIVDPAGAEVLTTRVETWTRDGHRYTEQLLLAKDHLYAIGEFASASAASPEHDARAVTAQLLAEWKTDRSHLLKRFDRNGDGTIDLAEWELARAAAREQATAQHAESALHLSPHRMQKPRDGRPYLLSNLQPGDLARRWTQLAWLQLAVGLSAAAVIGWIASQP